VVDGDVVHGVFATVGVVVASQQTVNLGVNEQVVVQTSDSRLRHARRPSTRGTADGPFASSARVCIQTRHAEGVAADQYLRTNPEPVVAQPTSEKFLRHWLGLIFTAVVRFRHVGIYHRRHRLTLISASNAQMCYM